MKAKPCLEGMLTIGPGSVRGSLPGPPLGNRERFDAADVDSSYGAVEGLPPLLFLTPRRDDVVVRRSDFPDGLTTVPLMRMAAGEERVAGRVTSATLGRVGAREIIRFLLNSEIIETRVHVEAELCLVEREERDGAIRERYAGSHTYYTNDRNVVPLDFTVTIDKSGVIRVRNE